MEQRLRGNADTIVSLHADHQQVLLYVLVGVRSLVQQSGKNYAESIMRIGELSHNLMASHEVRDINDPNVPIRLDVTQFVKELFDVIGWTPNVTLELYKQPADPEAVYKSFRSLAIKTGLNLGYVMVPEEERSNEW
jgi:hypothetical protein